MENLQIETKMNTPFIHFNSVTGLLKIVGRSIPENPIKFYTPLNNWMVSFIKSNPKDLIFYIHLDYLNTHSTECILILLRKIEAYYIASSSNVKVIWNFDIEDEDMESLGNDFASLINVPFTYKEIAEED